MTPIFGVRAIGRNAAKIDLDIVAFLVDEDEVEDIAEFLFAAIAARCIIEFGATPEILE